MGKRRIPTSKLRKIKEKYRDTKKLEIEEDTDVADPHAVSMEDAKLIAQDSVVRETGHTPKELKKNRKAALQNISKNFKSEKQIEAKWNFSIGDLVEFQDNDDKTTHIGIVVDFSMLKKHNSRSRAKNDGRVLLYSSCGRVWKKPAVIRKVE